MGIKIKLDHWVTFGWETERAIVLHFSNWVAWFPKKAFVESVQSKFGTPDKPEGKLKKFIKQWDNTNPENPEDWTWILDNKEWVLPKFVKRKKLAENRQQSVLFGETKGDRINFKDIKNEKKKIREQKKELRKRLKKSKELHKTRQLTPYEKLLKNEQDEAEW